MRRRQGRAAYLAALPLTLAALTATAGCQSRLKSGAAPEAKASPVVNRPVLPFAASGLTPAHVANEAALALWKRTLTAARTQAAHVHVTETRFAAPNAAGTPSQDVTTFEAVEGSPPIPHIGRPAHYRLEYSLPTRLAGVVLLCGGSSVWRYDPHTGVADRHSLASAPTPPELEEGVAGMPAQADGARPEIEGASETVASRPTQVLVLRRAGSGRTLERRWIDTQTGRTLRLEQYMGRDAHLFRRVEITQITYPKTAAELAEIDARLRPDFPANTKTVDQRPSHARHLAEAEETAGRVHLPLHVRGFALRSVASAPRTTRSDHSTDALTSPAAPPPHSTQLFYSNGEQAISVFVTPGDAVAAARKSSSAWHLTPLDGGQRGYAREIGPTAAAVIWNAPDGSYIAVSRMPLARLLPVAAAFAANRDDAPADRSDR